MRKRATMQISFLDKAAELVLNKKNNNPIGY